MQPYPHRIVTPSGTRYGIPVDDDGDLVTYRMLPLAEDQSAEAVEGAERSSNRKDDAEEEGTRDSSLAVKSDSLTSPLAGHAPSPAPYPRSIVTFERGGLRAIDRLKAGVAHPDAWGRD